METFLRIILSLCQPLAVIIFIISGIISLVLGLRTQGVVNLCFAITNFFVFYGERILKR